MRRSLCVAAVLALVTVVAFWPVVHCGFVELDDDVYLLRNPPVRAGLTMAGFRWALTATHGSLWMPLTWLSHMLDVQLWGLAPAGHHAVNLGLHVANAVLVLLLLARMTGTFWPSALAAALFALHPLRVESVAWVAERKDVLSAFFALLTLHAWVGWVRRGGAARYAGAVLCFALALLAKPMVVTLPFALLLLDGWPLGRLSRHGLARCVGEKAPLLALAAGATAVAVAAGAAHGTLAPAGAWPLVARLANALVSYGIYVRRTFWPSDLAVYYPLPHAWSLAALAATAALVAGVTLAGLALWRRRPWLLAGWLWFVGLLVPVIGLTQAGDQAMADRFTYLPLLGLFVIAAWGLRELPLRPGVAAAGAAALLLVLAGATRRQAAYWISSETLFARALAVTRDNWFIHNNLGAVLLRQGRLDEAAVQLEASLRIEPDHVTARYNLGSVRLAQRRTGEAIEEFRAALALDDGHVDARNNLGLAYLREGRLDEAVAALAETLRRRPDAAAHFNLALAQERQGRLDEALVSYEAAIRLRPGFAPAREHRTALLARLGRGVGEGPIVGRAAP